MILRPPRWTNSLTRSLFFKNLYKRHLHKNLYEKLSVLSILSHLYFFPLHTQCAKYQFHTLYMIHFCKLTIIRTYNLSYRSVVCISERKIIIFKKFIDWFKSTKSIMHLLNNSFSLHYCRECYHRFNILSIKFYTYCGNRQVAWIWRTQLL